MSRGGLVFLPLSPSLPHPARTVPVGITRDTRGPSSGPRENSALFLAMSNFRPHASLFAAHLAAALARLFGSHIDSSNGRNGLRGRKTANHTSVAGSARTASIARSPPGRQEGLDSGISSQQHREGFWHGKYKHDAQASGSFHSLGLTRLRVVLVFDAFYQWESFAALPRWWAMPTLHTAFE